jgi:Asp-tRNA(Asn)/Glu-tRNA(Gln) amidotransferase A subunit family amidase
VSTHIARHEPTVQAFVDGTFDGDRVLDANARSDERLPLNGLLLGVKDIINVDQFPRDAARLCPPTCLTDHRLAV